MKFGTMMHLNPGPCQPIKFDVYFCLGHFPDMTYNVFGGTLNPAQSICLGHFSLYEKAQPKNMQTSRADNLDVGI